MRGAPATDAGGGGPDASAEAAIAHVEAAHWRTVALERTAELQRLTRRPLVRLALALDRRVEPGRRALGAARARWAPVALHGMVTAGAVPARLARDGRRDALFGVVARVPPASPSTRRVSVIGCRLPVGAWSSAGGLEPDEVAAVADPAGDIGANAPAVPAVGALARAARTATGDLLCFVLTASEPLGEGWLARLADSVHGDVVAATPTLVHPGRTWRAATEHDWLVRSEGFDVSVDPSGAPVVAGRNAGRPLDGSGSPTDVVAAPLQCFVVDRPAYLDAGGLEGLEGAEPDVAAVDLCARLRGRGGRIVHVPGAVAFDDRPVPSRTALRTPIDGHSDGWRLAVERHGPRLVRAARPGAPTGTRWAITTAAPSAKVAARWGDWHLAEGVAAALRRLGHDVVVQTHDQADSLGSRSRDIHLVLRGLAPVRRTPGQAHVLWVISHPESLDIDECDAADLVVVASSRFAADLAGRTSTPVEVLLQATDPDRFRPQPPDPAHRHPVTVVAKTRGVLRPAVADALAAGIRPAIYGGGWRDLVDPRLVVADHVDNALLPSVYCSAGVVLNDHWDTMKAWGFVSNRVFDVLASGAPIISDDLAELHDLFGDAVPTYVGSDELGDCVRRALADPDAARAAAARGRALVLAGHTFDHRARQLLELVDRYGLAEPGP
jgi:hypothetical protein